jgi:hypothetical protein
MVQIGGAKVFSGGGCFFNGWDTGTREVFAGYLSEYLQIK